MSTHRAVTKRARWDRPDRAIGRSGGISAKVGQAIGHAFGDSAAGSWRRINGCQGSFDITELRSTKSKV